MQPFNRTPIHNPFTEATRRDVFEKASQKHGHADGLEKVVREMFPGDEPIQGYVFTSAGSDDQMGPSPSPSTAFASQGNTIHNPFTEANRRDLFERQSQQHGHADGLEKVIREMFPGDDPIPGYSFRSAGSEAPKAFSPPPRDSGRPSENSEYSHGGRAASPPRDAFRGQGRPLRAAEHNNQATSPTRRSQSHHPANPFSDPWRRRVFDELALEGNLNGLEAFIRREVPDGRSMGEFQGGERSMSSVGYASGSEGQPQFGGGQYSGQGGFGQRPQFGAGQGGYGQGQYPDHSGYGQQPEYRGGQDPGRGGYVGQQPPRFGGGYGEGAAPGRGNPGSNQSQPDGAFGLRGNPRFTPED